MTRAEVADILTAISSFDLRTVGEADVIAWHAVLGDLDKALALEAVVVHHKTSTDRIKPAHVVGIARGLLRDRLDKAAGEDFRAALPAAPYSGGLPINAEGDPVWSAYDVNGAITRECPRCHAEPNCACVTGRGTAQRIPCLERLNPKAHSGPIGGRA